MMQSVSKEERQQRASGAMIFLLAALITIPFLVALLELGAIGWLAANCWARSPNRMADFTFLGVAVVMYIFFFALPFAMPGNVNIYFVMLCWGPGIFFTAYFTLKHANRRISQY